MSDEKSETVESLLGRRVTEWLDPNAACGDSSYDCNTNRGWCACDVKRMKSHGVRAGVVSHKGQIAIFHLLAGETEKDVEKKLMAAEAAIENEKGGE